MKKFLFFKTALAALMFTGATQAMADNMPTASILSDLVAQSAKNTEYYYYYNVGKKMFLTAGGAWNTQAILSHTSSVYFTPVTQNTYTADGYTVYALWGEGALFTTTSDTYIGSGFNAVFTNGSGKGEAEYWAIKEVDTNNHYYAIIPYAGLKDNKTYYLGYDETTNSSYPGVYWTATELSDNEKWILVSATDYKTFISSQETVFSADSKKYYTFKTTGGYYATADTTTKAGKINASSSSDDAAKYVLISSGTKGYYYIYEPTLGKFLTENSEPSGQWSYSDNATAIKIVQNQTEISGGTSPYYLIGDNNMNANGDKGLLTWTDEKDKNSSWYITEAGDFKLSDLTSVDNKNILNTLKEANVEADLEVTLKNGYASVVLPFDVTNISSLEKVYKVTSVSSENMVYGEELTSITAGEPVLLKGSSSSVTFSGVPSVSKASESGLLTGIFAPTELGDNTTTYMMTGGIYKYYSRTVTLKPYRAYMTVTETSNDNNAKTLIFSLDDETTGISSVENTIDTDAPAFNLAGQKVNNSYNGIVVKHGKKMLTK